jgi:hypothetical protein
MAAGEAADRAGRLVELSPATRRLRAALGFLRLPPTEPELRLLHRWLDTWTGVGLITVGVERQGFRLSLSRIAEGEWRARFSVDPMISSAGYGVAPTPWGAVQMAAWRAVGGSA